MFFISIIVWVDTTKFPQNLTKSEEKYIGFVRTCTCNTPLTHVPVSHCVPLNPGAQLQLNPFARSVQMPLFLHGWLAHSSISVLEDKIKRNKNAIADVIFDGARNKHNVSRRYIYSAKTFSINSHSYSKQYYNQKRLLSLAPESYYLKTFRMLCLFILTEIGNVFIICPSLSWNQPGARNGSPLCNICYTGDFLLAGKLMPTGHQLHQDNEPDFLSIISREMIADQKPIFASIWQCNLFASRPMFVLVLWILPFMKGFFPLRCL